MKKLSSLVLPLCLSGLAWAADPATIQIEQPWARETPPTATNGAVYMTLLNRGDQPDRLVEASGEVAKTIELHTHSMEGNQMKMRPVASIEVEPGKPTVLKPGGLHIMLLDLKQPLVAGQHFPLTLHFEKAGNISVEVTVSKTEPEAKRPAGGAPKP
ncbi:MAG: copper chaperone PCu(A)C [Candidatus Competibacteraceae bacterium]